MAMQTLATPIEGCRDDPFGDGIARVGHSGSAYGLQSGLWLDLEGGKGVVWFLTGMPGDRLGGRSAFSAAEEALAQEAEGGHTGQGGRFLPALKNTLPLSPPAQE